MIVWLNGTFGAGKTTTARLLVRELPQARIFDTEYVGFMLRHVLTEPVDNFQDNPPWRALSVRTAVEVLNHVGGTLVIPQTVLTESFAREIFDGLAAEGVKVHHFVLHVDREELVRRIESDHEEAGAKQWRLDHVTRYEQALPWLRAAGTIVDTTRLTPAEAVGRIIGGL
ncbi:AAA family ATPase [Kutzneria sp. CA-103260]|uniref:AAA family ATPase n=1 Tax=Kutzneria sp. CA-103260 TaxID=2802641 RepID=UPI001BAD138B|nr:AAA family ATPase [Kutzneria sp. CA-103260]QUQ66502.1 ATP-binding protein [Kutzneria sp. CA-103260]